MCIGTIQAAAWIIFLYTFNKRENVVSTWCSCSPYSFHSVFFPAVPSAHNHIYIYLFPSVCALEWPAQSLARSARRLSSIFLNRCSHNWIITCVQVAAWLTAWLTAATVLANCARPLDTAHMRALRILCEIPIFPFSRHCLHVSDINVVCIGRKKNKIFGHFVVQWATLREL